MLPIGSILALALFGALIFLAFCGNILVCSAIFSDRKLRKQPENLFLVSLAISDLFVSVLVGSFLFALAFLEEKISHFAPFLLYIHYLFFR
jgi:hypothetical protein